MAQLKEINADMKHRAPIKILVDYKDSDLFMFDYAQNISKAGLFLETTKTLPIGTTVLLSFTLPQSPKLITALGEVVWCQRNSSSGSSPLPGMGIRFREISQEDEKLIAEYIKRFERSALGLGGPLQDELLESCSDLGEIILE